MSVPRVSSGKPASTTAAIIAAARDAFLDEGFEAASMDAIARRADVSKATLYAHFAGKDTLFTAVMQALRDEYRDQLDQLAATQTGDVAARLTRAGNYLLEVMLSPRKLCMFRVILTESERIPEICQTFIKAMREHAMNRIADLFRDGVSTGQLVPHDADVAGRQFVSLLRGDLVWTSLMTGPGITVSEAEISERVASTVALFVRCYAIPCDTGPGVDKSDDVP